MNIKLKMKAKIIENGDKKFKSPYLPLSLFDKFTMTNSSVELKYVCVYMYRYVD